jgi:PAS domain S-box-containing protein
MKLKTLKGLLTEAPLPIDKVLLMTCKIVEALKPWTKMQKVYGYLNPHHIKINSRLTDVELSDNFETDKFQVNDFKVYRYIYIAPEQTGRMNRSVDYRADFYSLGVILYELLTGRKPFESTDILELAHCHLAKNPRTPTTLFTKIPQTVSLIVMKLMEKSADDRYQSIVGLLADLEECLSQFKKNGRIVSFQLARYDFSDKFIIPQKLYGRDKEVDKYLNVFSQVCSGNRALMLVSGYSGCGKSALVHEIYKPLSLQRGYFISGKFDQFTRNIPYSAVILALTELMQQILTQSNEQLIIWQNKIIEALGTNAQVIINVIPELEMVIGSQPDVPTLGSVEASNRFNLVFQNFIRVFCENGHPLILFLDDLQWVDSASIKLIELMITDTRNKHLLLVGAYRDNEVDATHQLIVTIEQLKKQDLVIMPLKLSSLKLSDVKQLLGDTFQASNNKVDCLAKLIMQKTEGNPFFVKQFLRTIHEDELLTFDSNQNCWQWDIKQLEEEKITDNVVDLMIGRLKKLPPNTQHVLKLAACIGNSFDIKTLSIIYQKKINDTFLDLFPAIQNGLLLQLTKQKPDDIQIQLSDNRQGSQFCFLHDRVQQAADSMIPVEEKPQLHLKIGRLLLDWLSKAEQEQRLFEVVDHFNQGYKLIVDPKEKLELAELNLVAARKAKSSLANEAALKYVQQGLLYLPKNSWGTSYDLSLAFYLEKGELEYLNTLWDEAIATFDYTYTLANDLLSRCKISEYKATLYRMKNDLRTALNIGIQALSELGIKINAFPPQTEVLTEIKKFSVLIEDQDMDTLYNLPDLKDPLKLSAMALLRECFAPAYFLGSNLTAIIGIKMTEITLRYGNSSHSSVGYIFYSSITLAVSLSDFENAYRFGLLSLKLNDEKYHIKAYEALIYDMFGTFVSPYKESIPVARDILMRGYYSGLENGSYQWAGYCAIISLFQSFWGLDTLDEVSSRIERISPGLQKIDQNMLQYYYAVKATIFNLTEQNSSWQILSESIWPNSTEILNTCRAQNDLLTLFVDAVCHLSLANWYANPLKAVEYTKLAEQYLAGAPGIYLNPVFHFHRALAYSTAYNMVDTDTQQAFMVSIDSDIALFKTLAKSCPVTYLHHLLLIKAEHCRITGNNWNAVEYYDKAIKSAIDNKFIQDAAFANELAARFWITNDNLEIANVYLKKAHHYYKLWGANGKIKDLENKYPEVFSQSTPLTNIESIPNIQQQGNLSLLDLYSVIKAANVISGEIVFSQLLEKMMRIVVENAGAQYGALFLVENNNLIIEAEFDFKNDSVNIFQSESIEKAKNIALSVLNYVMRTKESIVLHDAAHKGDFIRDLYIKNNDVLSILAIPLINQGDVSGILYLENNLSIGVFTSERIQVINLLTTQVRISIENAKLFKERETAVNNLVSEQDFTNTVIDTFPDTFFVFNPLTGKAIRWNKAFTEISGYLNSEIRELKAPESYYSEKDLIKASSATSDLIAHGKATVEMNLITKKRDKIPTEYTSGIIKDKNGKPKYIISIGRNITERKKAEKEIAIKNNEIASQNEEYLALNEELKHSNEELQLAKEKAEENKAFIQLQYIELQSSEEELRSSNEELVATSDALKISNKELIVAKDKAEESERLLSKIAENYPNSFLSIIEKDLTVGFTSGQEFKRQKLNPQEFIGLTLEQVFGEHTQTVKNYYLKTFTGEETSFELFINNQYQLYKTVPLYSENNEITKILSVVENITSRKIAEQELLVAKEKAEESDRLKTEFINNMSHEIRTPMNGILGFSKLLEKTNKTEQKRKYYINIIQNSGNQLMRIIDDILEISRLGTKQVKTIEQEICLNDILLELFSIFDIKAKENKTPLYLKKGLSDIESNILSDETKLNKILSNLLENALKFTSEGFIEFGYQQVNRELEFYVKDTGIGIASNKQEIIFERFSQEEKELSKNVGGLGLGLSIAKENAELLGGKISLKSEKGKGATFFVTVPYKPASSKITTLGNDINEIADKQKHYTILIVEDEEVNYLYIETLLEDEIELNCKTLHAKNGQESIDICKNNEIDLVLMDLKMPIMNGFEATKRIKELRSDLPIVAQTAYTTNEAFSAGCDNFISKPTSEETLNEIINKYLIK